MFKKYEIILGISMGITVLLLMYFNIFPPEDKIYKENTINILTIFSILIFINYIWKYIIGRKR